METKAKILVIDDCAMQVFVMERVLKNAGFDVLVASSGRRAIELLQRGGVDLVVTDIHMPEMDGVELLQFAQREKLTMPFVAISGHEWPMNMFRMARLLGAVFTLKKPLTAEHLVETVEAALDRRNGSLVLKMAADAGRAGGKLTGN